jgi:hypothetical protein
MKAAMSQASSGRSCGAAAVLPGGMFEWMKAAAVATLCIPAAALKLSGPQSGGCR